MEPQANRRPGDQILDRHAPHLSGTDRELARERLQGLAKLLLNIAMRQVREDMQAADSRDGGSGGIISPTPQPPPP